MSTSAITSPSVTEVANVEPLNQTQELSSVDARANSVATSVIMKNGEVLEATKTINGEVVKLSDEEAQDLVKGLLAQQILELALTELFFSTFLLPIIDLRAEPIEDTAIVDSSPQVVELKNEPANQLVDVKA